MRGLIAGAAICAAFLLVLAGNSRGQNDYPNCAGWIQHSCCCTNECCSEVVPGEVEHLSGDQYRIVASGQIVKRTGWSQDGRFMRCACDLINGRWTKHATAHTRCLFPPMPSS